MIRGGGWLRKPASVYEMADILRWRRNYAKSYQGELTWAPPKFQNVGPILTSSNKLTEEGNSHQKCDAL